MFSLARAVLLAVALGPADDAPAPAPSKTAWALAGARSWRLCDEVGQQAQASLASSSRGRGDLDSGTWVKRVRQCPNDPAVLLLAAQSMLADARAVPSDPIDPKTVDELANKHRERLAQAEAWLRNALAEASRRGEMAPLGVNYYLGYVLLGQGRYREAEAMLRTAVARGEVERWRTAWLGALLALMQGRLDEAIDRAHRGVVDAPIEDRAISRYIWAYVLDRAGALASAREQFDLLRREAGILGARDVVEAVLPFHERLYFRALDHEAADERSNAIRLWDAYLARPEPAEPERVLARRHRAELEPLPPTVGGPMQ